MMKNLKKTFLLLVLAFLIIPSTLVMAEIIPYKYVDGVKCIDIIAVLKEKGEKVLKTQHEVWGKGYKLTFNSKDIEIYEDAPYMFFNGQTVTLKYKKISEDGLSIEFPLLEKPIKQGENLLIPMFTAEKVLGIKGTENGIDIDELKNPSEVAPNEKPVIPPTSESNPDCEVGPKEWPELEIKPSIIKPNTGIKLNNTILEIDMGKTFLLKINNSKKKVTWSSSNPKIATVSKYGTVSGVSNGIAVITATVDGYDYECAVYVNGPHLSNTEICIFKGQDANINLLNNNNVKGKWSIDDPSVVSMLYDVNTLYNGEQYISIKANKIGTTKINVKVGNFTLTCNVKVVEKNDDLIVAGDKIRKSAEEYGLIIHRPNHIEYYHQYHPNYDYGSWISLYDDFIGFVIPSWGTGTEEYLPLLKEFICTVLPEHGEMLFDLLIEETLTTRELILNDKIVKLSDIGSNRILEITNRVW